MVDRDAFVSQSLEREAARVFAYCRALVGRDDVAASVTEAALNSARSMLQDPDRLRAWLFALALRQRLTSDVSGAASDSREAFELVYRHGIHREDLGAVLGVPADEAAALLAAAEVEFDRGITPAELDGAEPDGAEPDGAEDVPGRVDLISGQSLLQHQLRAWLFALARQEALAAVSGGTAAQAAWGVELTGYAGVEPRNPGPVLGVAADEASGRAAGGDRERRSTRWWRRSAAQPGLTGRRKLIALLTAIPLAAAVGVVVYLGGVGRPVGSRAAFGPGSAATGPVGPPRPVRSTPGPAAVAPPASPSSAVPISALFPASPTTAVKSSPPTSPAPTPTPTPKPSPKPSPTPTPKPSPTPTPKPSPTPTPKPSQKSTPTPTPKPTTG